MQNYAGILDGAWTADTAAQRHDNAEKLAPSCLAQVSALGHRDG